MVDGIRGRSGSLAHEAMLAAMKRQAAAAEEVRTQGADVAAKAVGGAPAGEAAQAPSFADAIREGLAEVNAEVRKADTLPEELLTGKVGDISEVATRLKTAELTFRFSMEIRNKLIDAYREVMRMQV